MQLTQSKSAIADDVAIEWHREKLPRPEVTNRYSFKQEGGGDDEEDSDSDGANPYGANPYAAEETKPEVVIAN